MTTANTTSHHDCDALIIGSGQAAPALAVALAGRGERVILVEGNKIGGSCVNVGCTPTKTLRKSARVAYMARRAGEFGVNVGAVTIDFAKAMDRTHERVNASRAGLEGWLVGTPNVTVLRGWGSLAGHTDKGFAAIAEASGVQQHITAKRVYLNTGTRPFMPPIKGLESGDARILNNESLLELRECPKHLAILGGSYIGLEFAQIFRRLGAEVTVIEPSSRIAMREDEITTNSITAFLQEEGIQILTDTTLELVDVTSPHLQLYTQTKNSDGSTSANTRTASHLLVATGRLPNTEKLNLASIGLALDSRGYVDVNDQLETSVAGVWALGDINKRGAFTHTSYHDFEIVRDNLKRKETTNQGDIQTLRSAADRVTTYAMFTDPPLGRVGLNASSAKAESEKTGRQFLIAEHHMRFVSRAKEESETHGLIQFIVDAKTEAFAGATVLGINGDEIIQVVGNYMATGASYRLMRDCLPAHPTVTEFFPTILDKLKPL
jgi:pyruvate/2-oxoglutarate dehydrogenase complex dihydrolipoamide dehydrogenase (E3) component